MTNTITVEPKVWADIHRPYVAEHVGYGVDSCERIADMLTLYSMTGQAVYWQDAMTLVRSLNENMTRGSLNRVRAIAYFVCEPCDSDLCDHAERFNG
jgi:hypothetical protein